MTGIAGKDIGNFRFAHVQDVGKLLSRGFALIFLLKGDEGFIGLIISANLILWKAHQSSLLGQGLQYRLTDPPYSIRNKFKALGFIKALCGFDKSQVALIDKVAQRQALMLVLFGY